MLAALTAAVSVVSVVASVKETFVYENLFAQRQSVLDSFRAVVSQRKDVFKACLAADAEMASLANNDVPNQEINRILSTYDMAGYVAQRFDEDLRALLDEIAADPVISQVLTMLKSVPLQTEALRDIMDSLKTSLISPESKNENSNMV